MARYQRTCVVINQLGLHARPSTLIVKLVTKEIGSQIVVFIKKDKLRAAANSIMEVMMLCVPKGQELVVYTDDRRYDYVVEKVADLISNMPDFD